MYHHGWKRLRKNICVTTALLITVWPSVHQKTTGAHAVENTTQVFAMIRSLVTQITPPRIVIHLILITVLILQRSPLSLYKEFHMPAEDRYWYYRRNRFTDWCKHTIWWGITTIFPHRKASKWISITATQVWEHQSVILWCRQTIHKNMDAVLIPSKLRLENLYHSQHL